MVALAVGGTAVVDTAAAMAREEEAMGAEVDVERLAKVAAREAAGMEGAEEAAEGLEEAAEEAVAGVAAEELAEACAHT